CPEISLPLGPGICFFVDGYRRPWRDVVRVRASSTSGGRRRRARTRDDAREVCPTQGRPPFATGSCQRPSSWIRPGPPVAALRLPAILPLTAGHPVPAPGP